MTMISAQTLRRPGGLSRVAGLIGGVIETALLWLTRGRDRRDLAGLNDRMLLDIGVTRADVEREYRKPFWRD